MVANKRNKGLGLKYEIGGLVLLSVGILILVSLFSTRAGVVGILLEKLSRRTLGYGALLIPFISIYAGIVFMGRGRKKRFSGNILGAILLVSAFLATLHINYPDTDMWRMGWAGGGGGIAGACLAYVLFNIFGLVGSYIIIITLGLIGLVLITNISLFALVNGLGNKLSVFIYKLKELCSGFSQDTPKEEFKVNVAAADTAVKLAEPAPVPINEAKEGTGREVVTNKAEEQAVDFAPMFPRSGASLSYQLPPLNLLRRNQLAKVNRWQKNVTDNIKLLEQTLAEFGVKAKVIEVSRGPAITRYELQLAPGTKVSRIVSLADDISLHLATADIRIEAPIPGKAAVGIEVPNKEVTPVFLREVVETPLFQESASKLTFALGKNIAGEAIVANLSNMPHLLIAGATGAGKSVYLNALLASLLFRVKPDEVKFILIDPKRVELSLYNNLPHLLTPVVVEPQRAAAALCWLVQEMENRYNLFAQKGVRDIDSYNSILSPHEREELFLPFIVVIIDELADLMLVAPNEVEDAICRLAQMARAAGIHLVIATQRPSVDVITGLIKANIPSRISFAVSSQIDSRTILDMGGAEKLLGKGDMLFLPAGASKPFRIQGAYVSDKEVEKLVVFWQQQAEPEYCEEVFESELTPAKANKQFAAGDELFTQALSLVVEQQQASASMLQRRFRIGYTRAARLIDMLEEKGYVGPSEGSKPRQVLISKERLQRILEENHH